MFVRKRFSIPVFWCLVIVCSIFTGACATMQTEPSPTKNEPSSHRFTTVKAKKGDSFASLAEEHLHDRSLDWLIAEVNDTAVLTPGDIVVIPFVPWDPGGLREQSYRTVTVLCYHKFTKGRGDMMTVSEKAFKEQMRFLKENGYRVLTMDEFFDFIDYEREIPKKSVVITIDDGWRSAYEIAFPVLKRYGYPATLFVYTDFVSKGGDAMDWRMLTEMSRNGIQIECHTKTHRYLDRRLGKESYRDYFETVKREIADAGKIIKEKTNRDVRYLSYPYGETNHVVIAILVKLGYRGAFTIGRGGNPFFADPFRINRSMIYGTFNLDDFKKNLKISANETLR